MTSSWACIVLAGIVLNEGSQFPHGLFGHVAAWEADRRQWWVHDGREAEVVEAGDGYVLGDAQAVFLEGGNQTIGGFVV